MPMLAHARISSLGYLCMHRPRKGSCYGICHRLMYSPIFCVIVRRHLVRILSTFQLRARLQNSRVFFFSKWFRVEQEQRKSLTRANMRTRKAREKKTSLPSLALRCQFLLRRSAK